MEREKEIIRTIYHKDVANFFESIGLSEKLAHGEIRCSVCGEIITLDNFGAAARKSMDLLFCCNKESCIHEFISRLRSDKA